ncbi:cyclin-dependent kinase, partial [Trifolium pratense]
GNFTVQTQEQLSQTVHRKQNLASASSCFCPSTTMADVNRSNKPEWLQQYDLIGKIGEGTYGLVFLARIKSATNRGKSIAIKKFKQSKDGDGVSPTAIREIMLLREITHENVVKLVNVHINHADMSLYLAFDYAEHDLYVS